MNHRHISLLVVFTLTSACLESFAQYSGRKTLTDSNAPLQLSIGEMDTTGFPDVRLKVKLLQGMQVLRDTGFTDIQLSENGLWQDARISCEVRPFVTAMVLDKSLSMAFFPNSRDVDPDSARWNNAKAALHMFIDQILPIDRLTLISFARDPFVDQSLTADIQLLHDKLEGIRLTTGTGIWKAVNRALDLLQPVNERRAIVVLTDGEDNASGFITMNSVASRARSLGIRVYTIGLGEDASRLSLSDLAVLTGGKFFFSATGDDLVAIYREISSDLAEGCTITYTTSNFCTDGRLRLINLVGRYKGEIALKDTLYTAPLDIPTVRFALSETVPMLPGETFRVAVTASDTVNAVEPMLFRAKIRYPAADLVFEEAITRRHVLEGVRLEITDENGLLSITADTSMVARSGLILLELLFRVRDREAAAAALLEWESVEMLRFCAYNTQASGATVMLDGYCEPLLGRANKRLLGSAYPNPFRGGTTFMVNIPEEAAGALVEISVLDPLGAEIARLFSGSLPAGERTMTWDSGKLPAGVYSIQAVAGSRRDGRQVVLLR